MREYIKAVASMPMGGWEFFGAIFAVIGILLYLWRREEVRPRTAAQKAARRRRTMRDFGTTLTSFAIVVGLPFTLFEWMLANEHQQAEKYILAGITSVVWLGGYSIRVTHEEYRDGKA